MSRPLRLEPVWIDDLLSMYVAQDLDSGHEGMGYPSVCPSFRIGNHNGFVLEEPEGYSALEVLAVEAAMERLAVEVPEEHAALQAMLKPYRGVAFDAGVARAGARRLAGWVDEAIDGL